MIRGYKSSGKPLRQRIYEAITKGDPMLLPLDPSMIGKTNLEKANAASATHALGKDVFDRVYGDNPMAFLDRYKNFETEFFKALREERGSEFSVLKSNMLAAGQLDIGLLSKGRGDELRNLYMSSVINLPDLITAEGGGIPGVMFPNANGYNEAYLRYSVDFEQGIYNPAQVLINNTNFNYNPTKEGLSALKASDKIMTSESIMSNFNAMQSLGDISGKRAMTLDVETSGLLKTSQVTEFALTGLEDGNVNLISAKRFQHPYLSGIRIDEFVKGTRSDAIEMGVGGVNFLDEAAELLETINREADVLVGQNISFDIQRLVHTITSQEGYSSHTKVKDALRIFEQKRAAGDFVVDTAVIARMFMDREAQTYINSVKNIGDPNDINSAYLRAVFSDESLAQVRTGGSARMSSMENILTNTNLFELMEGEGSADEIFSKILRGSHVSDTDTILESYLMKYIQSGELKTWPNAAGPKTELGNALRGVIATSKPRVTDVQISNIADVSSYVTADVIRGDSQAVRGMTIRISGPQDYIASARAGLGISGTTAGTIKYTEGKGFQFFEDGMGFVNSVVNSESTQAIEGVFDISETSASRYISSIVEEALNETRMSSVTLPGGTRATINLAQQQIMGFGVTYGQSAAIDDIMAVQEAGIRAKRGIRSLSRSQITEALSSVYTEFSSGLSMADTARVLGGRRSLGSFFDAGMNEYNEEAAIRHAGRMASISDPFYFLDPKSRVISTSVSEATYGLINSSAKSMKNSSNVSKQQSKLNRLMGTDLISSLGVSAGGRQFYSDLFDPVNIDEAAERGRNITAPIGNTSVVNRALMNTTGQGIYGREVKMSIPKGGAPVQGNMSKMEAAVNFKLMFDYEGGSEDAAKLADELVRMYENPSESGLYNLTRNGDEALFGSKRDVNRVAASLGAIEDPVKKAHARSVLAKNLTQSIIENGLVVGTVRGKDATKVINDLGSIGINISNDMMLNHRARILNLGYSEGIYKGGGESGILTFSPFYDKETVMRTGMSDYLDNATKYAKRHYTGVAGILDGHDAVSQITTGVRRSKVGQLTASGIYSEIYQNAKPTMKLGALALGAAIPSYYLYRNYQENNLYDETIEPQPYEATNQVKSINSDLIEFNSAGSSRRDPLRTAGVVGNLDRSKINHTQMGNRKYDHLFQGA